MVDQRNRFFFFKSLAKLSTTGHVVDIDIDIDITIGIKLGYSCRYRS